MHTTQSHLFHRHQLPDLIQIHLQREGMKRRRQRKKEKKDEEKEDDMDERG